MKKIFIIANWKSNKSQIEAIDWLEQAEEMEISLPENKTLVLCPSFTLLADVSFFIQEHKLPIYVGAQDISPFDSGAYTGAVNAKQIKEFGDYTIIGHSERRRFFNETDEILKNKVELSQKYGLKTIYCVQSKNDTVPEGVDIVGYEPVGSIGTGQPDSPENANEMAKYIKGKYSFVQFVLYGGSVIAENVANFTQQSYIDGVIPGGASLDPKNLFGIVENS